MTDRTRGPASQGRQAFPAPADPAWRRRGQGTRSERSGRSFRARAFGAAAVALAVAVPVGLYATNATAATLAQESFDAPLKGWSRSGGSWQVKDGALVQSRSTSARARLLTGSSAWTDYQVDASVALGTTGSPIGSAGLLARVNGSASYLRLAVNASGTASFQQVRGNSTQTIGEAPVTAPDQFHALRIVANGTQVEGWLDGRIIGSADVGSASVGTVSRSGRVGFMTTNAAARFDNFLVTPVTPSPGPTPTVTPTAPVPPTTTPTATPTRPVPPTATPPAPPTATPTVTATVQPPTTTPGPTGAGAWTPPAKYSAALDKVWDHQMTTYGNPMGFKNYIWDQIMATKGKINYCVRWDSKKTVTAAQRDAIEAQLQRQANKWAAAMTSGGVGWDGFPYTSFDVKVVGWATRDRSLLQWSDNKVDVYVGDMREDAPQCAEPCGRFFNKTNDYSRCPGGAARHYDMSLWLTDGFGGGAGGDWGQRMGTDYFLNNLNSADDVIYLHEFGHGLGLDDFYDWDPGVGGFVMMAGSSGKITEFDTWMARDWWRHLKSRYGL